MKQVLVKSDWFDKTYSWQWMTGHKVSRAKLNSLHSKVLPIGGIERPDLQPQLIPEAIIS